MKTQPSHGLFCPHPCPRPRLPFPQPRPTRRYLSGLRPEAAPARNRDAGVGWGIPRSGSSGMDPGSGFAPNGDALDGYDPRLGPKKYLKCLKWGLRLPRGRQRNYPHLCHRDPCPPAAKELPVTFPPNALPTQIHTNTPIPCAAASRGGGWGEEAAREEREQASLSGRKSCS